MLKTGCCDETRQAEQLAASPFMFLNGGLTGKSAASAVTVA